MSRHRRRRAYRTRQRRRAGRGSERWWRLRGFSSTDYIGKDPGGPGGTSKGFWVLYCPIVGKHADLIVCDEAGT